MPACDRGLPEREGAYGPVTTEYRFRRGRTFPLPRGNPSFSDAAARRRIYARQALCRA
ncbi:MAG TPA: hypothetical protein VNS02_04950 [Rhizobiaceae bacterium]|nr:hypothetical protein [Rhizobiaceae bacterium]